MIKLAFVITPDIDLMDLMLFAEPLRQAEKLGLVFEDLRQDFCSPNKLPDSLLLALGAYSILPIPADSLTDYDLVVLPGTLNDAPPDGLNQLLQTVTAKTTLLTSGNASAFLDAKLKSASSHAANRKQTLILGVELVERIGGKAAAAQTASALGLAVSTESKESQNTRQASISRKTKETSIDLQLALDGSGRNEIETGIPFFDHMLTQIAVHGLFDLTIRCKGDLQVDPHHTVEDVGLALGKAFDQALGDRKGLVRMASATIPMDECLAQVTLDFSGRPYCVVQADWQDIRIGDLPVSLISHFLESFAVQARCNLFVRLLAIGDDHHRAEAIFKALARALDAATQIDPRRLQAIPSSKGVI